MRAYLGCNFIAVLDPLFECIEYGRERFHSGVITSVIDRIRLLPQSNLSVSYTLGLMTSGPLFTIDLKIVFVVTINIA